MVKILAAADFHGNYGIADKLSKKAKKNNVDLIVLAGDLHGTNEGEGGILDIFLKEKQKVLFIPGNWDSTGEHDLLRRRVKSIHNYYVTYGDVGFVGIGTLDMKMSLDDNDFSKIKKQFDRIKTKKNILVSHLHARGTKAEFSGVLGDDILRKAVEKFHPDLLISAHIHEAEGIEDVIGNTRVVQVGRSGKIIEI